MEYKKRYKEDSSLPSAPNYVYKNDFPSWMVFLGKKKKIFYNTWQEASRATRKLGIVSRQDYEKKYKQNSNLPYSPKVFYKNFPGWIKFLGKEK